jgi:hypothetical protein
MNKLTQVSHALVAIGGAMIGSGWYRHNEASMWVGGVVALVSLVLMFWPSKK